MKQFLTDLRTISWRTAGARYNAARRLERREWFSTFSLATLSALSIAVAFMQKVYSPTPGTPLDNYLSLLAVALGVFLLAITLIEWGGRYGAKAEALHRNAELLTAFQVKLAQTLAQIDHGTLVNNKDVDDLRLEYEAIKEKCPHNHMPCDDGLFISYHRWAAEFKDTNGKPKLNLATSLFKKVLWHLSAFWFLGIIWILVLGALIYSLWVPKS